MDTRDPVPSGGFRSHDLEQMGLMLLVWALFFVVELKRNSQQDEGFS